MKLTDLVEIASSKANFIELKDYIGFCEEFLGFISGPGNIQAEIVSRNETHYRFIQFKNPEFSISRPLNSKLLYSAVEAKRELKQFLKVLDSIRGKDNPANRQLVNRAIYTIQQSIGASLDALPAGKSNTARKINGDLFERFIRLILCRIGVECTSGTVRVPIEIDGKVEFSMSYQHDLIIKSGELVKIIGSVKTSSKDRLDKIFVDKFLLARLTGADVPHIAVFLNDVQRKGRQPGQFGINSTFLPGHFKGYTIRLNPLDGVYYLDIRPNMVSDDLLSKHIQTFDHFIFGDVWELLGRQAITAQIASNDNK